MISRTALRRVPRSTTSTWRTLSTTTAQPSSPSPSPIPPQPSTSSAPPSFESEPNTHYKITLKRSAIGLPDRYKATLEALGIWKRMQTVYMPHSPEAAGKILRLKELIQVENVPASQVKTKLQQREERKAPRGYVVIDRLVS